MSGDATRSGLGIDLRRIFLSYRLRMVAFTNKGSKFARGVEPNQNSVLSRRLALRQWLGAAAGAGLTTFLSPELLAAPNRVKTVVIDPGHGGEDGGATEGLVFEKHLNFDVSRRLEIQLQRRNYKTVLTRDRDEFISLSARSNMANKYRDVIFVSIHFNSASRTSAYGIETFYYSYDGYQLASRVHTSVCRKLRPENRGVKKAAFSVIRNTKCPAILVEGGFLSNSKERNRCVQPWYRQALAESIAVGIDVYAIDAANGKL
jgi:N-acetylmuramoyl-L-alanine amidase